MECNVDTWSFRDLVDWDYYIERLGKTIQKIVSIPAGKLILYIYIYIYIYIYTLSIYI